MAIAFVNGASDHRTSAATVRLDGVFTSPRFQPPVAGNALIVFGENGSDPGATTTLATVVTDVAAVFQRVGISVEISGSHHTCMECWPSLVLPAGITAVTGTWNADSLECLLALEYSGVAGIGRVMTAVGTTTNPTITLETQDANNWVVAGFSLEGAGLPAPNASVVGTFRTGSTDGGGAATAPTGTVDNTAVSPGLVTCTLFYPVAVPWAAVAVELRTVAPTPILLPKSGVYA